MEDLTSELIHDRQMGYRDSSPSSAGSDGQPSPLQEKQEIVAVKQLDEGDNRSEIQQLRQLHSFKSKVSQQAVRERSTNPTIPHSPLPIKTLKSSIPSSPIKTIGLTRGAVTALKRGACMQNDDVNAVMEDGKQKLAVQVVMSDDEERRKGWLTSEFRPILRVKQYIWGGVPLGNLPKVEWIVTDGENEMRMKPNYFRNCRKMARGFFHKKGAFMKKKLMRNCRFQLVDYVTGMSDVKEPTIYVEKIKWLPN
jgi:hypothetical protein